MHDAKTQMPGQKRERVEPSTIVLDTEPHAVAVPNQVDLNMLRVRVLDDVAERLLRNSIENHLNLWRQPALTVDIHVHLECWRAPGGRLSELLHQVREIHLRDRRRPQLDQHRSHLGQCSPGKALKLLNGASPLLWIGGPDTWQRLRIQSSREERLRHRVM